MSSGLISVMRREIQRLTSRPIYICGMVLIPLAMMFFFIGILGEGLPLKVPAAVVDLDHTPMSRQLVRSLNASELIDVQMQPTSYHEAMEAVQRGDIIGFFMIPDNFERDAVAGRGPALTYYYNLTIYVPGSLMFKGFKTMAVSASGALVQTNLVQKGAPEAVAGVLLQPMTVNTHSPGNPWLNYSYYLCPSFLFGILELMVLLMTAYSITDEIKTSTSPDWLRTGRGRIGTALVGKLLPQTIIFSLIGICINMMMYGWHHFPMNGSLLWLNVGMVLMIIASQAYATAICAVVPNPRFALSLCSLSGILAFSLAAISFPVEAMYGGMAVFSYILPMRWYFLIFADIALDGLPLYFSRMYFVYLLIFPIVATLLAPRMKRALRKPVYLP